MPKRSVESITIFDTTLRDGAQSPGFSASTNEKLIIARQLDRLGVDAIEAGMPISSKGELESVRIIARDGLKAKVCALARSIQADIDAAVDSGVDYVHIFIATSDIHLEHKLKLSREQALQKAVESIDYAKSHGLSVEYSAEDATRTDLNYLKSFYKAVDEAGADILNVPDTVGTMTPKGMSRLIEELKAVVKKPLSVHCHNDFGLAVANTLAGIEAGASQAHVTINGLGERAGNASLEEVIVGLNLLYGWKTNVKTELIYQTSQLVSRLGGISVQPNKAIVGENAFAHEAGIHTHGLVASPLTYEPIKPEFVGRSRRFVAGKLSGSHGIMAELEGFGLHPTKDQLSEIVGKVKERGDKGERVTDNDLLKIAMSVMGDVVPLEKRVELNEFAVMTGSKVTPTASVTILLDKKAFSSAETGVGPVDAAMRAIQKITSDVVNVRLKEYRLEALTGGSDAVASVEIKVEDKDGNVASSRGAGEDIVKASVEAMLNGINLLLLKRKRASAE